MKYNNICSEALHQLKMTKFTIKAFVVTTQSNMIAGKELMVKFNFQYVRPGVFSHDPREIFFGRTIKQQSRRNLCIDIVDVVT